MQVRRGGGGGEPHPHRVADEGYELRPHGGASDDDGWCGPPASYAKLVLPASLPVGLCPFMPASLQPMAKVIRLWSGTRPNAYHCPDMSAGVQPMPALLVKYGRWLVQPEPAGFSQGDLDREFHLHQPPAVDSTVAPGLVACHPCHLPPGLQAGSTHVGAGGAGGAWAWRPGPGGAAGRGARWSSGAGRLSAL